ncbi:MAG: hypothetical protein DRO40_01155 [Thermoprotei archaeon]|nr:MAG: hypothetical protein DRO40_01155 [Thermoprotei archaeon]
MLLKQSFYRVLFVVPVEGAWSLDQVVEKLGISYSTAKRYVKELIKLGFVDEVQVNRYKITSKGLLFRSSILGHLTKHLDKGQEYIFTEPTTSTPISLSIKNLHQLYVSIKYELVPWDVVKEHIKSGRLLNWIRDVLGDQELYMKLSELRNSLSREEFLEIIENRLKIIESIRSLKVL